MHGDTLKRRNVDSAADSSDSGQRVVDDPVLAVDGLTKTFGDGADAVTAVNDVSFAVEPGSVVGLLGPNGAGKTTTIKAVLGMVVPDSGSVEICGIDAREHPHAAHREVGAMLEGARNDYWRLTVRENLRYFARVAGSDPATTRPRQEDLLEKLGLLERADDVVRDLSRGMKQKVALASTLASDVSLAFLDEPTLGLDVEGSLRLRREISRIAAERDVTILLSSHDMRVIRDVCDRAIVMQGGEVVADETVTSLQESVDERTYRFVVTGLEDGAEPRLRDAVDDLEIQQQGSATVVTASADSDGFYRLSDALEVLCAEVESVGVQQPDLERAFLDLTDGGERA